LTILKRIAGQKGVGEIKRHIKIGCDFISDRYQVQFEKLKEELYEQHEKAMEEKNKAMLEYADLKYENQMLKYKMLMLKQKTKMSDIASENFLEEIKNLKKELSEVQNYSGTFKASYLIAQGYVKSLEAEINEYKRLLKNVPTKAVTMSQQVVNNERKGWKAMNTINELAISQFNRAVNREMQTKATLTELCDIDRDIRIVEEPIEILYKDTEVNAIPETAEKEIIVKCESAECEVLTSLHDIRKKIEISNEKISKEVQCIGITNTIQCSIVLESITRNKTIATPSTKSKTEFTPLKELKIIPKGTFEYQSLGIELLPSVNILCKARREGSREKSNRSKIMESSLYSVELPSVQKKTEERKESRGGIKKLISESKVVYNTPQVAGTSELKFTNVSFGQFPEQFNEENISLGRIIGEIKRKKYCINDTTLFSPQACLLCKSGKRNPKRPIIKIAPFNINGFERYLEKRMNLNNVIKLNKETQTEDGVEKPHTITGPIRDRYEAKKHHVRPKHSIRSKSGLNSLEREVADYSTGTYVSAIPPSNHSNLLRKQPQGLNKKSLGQNK